MVTMTAYPGANITDHGREFDDQVGRDVIKNLRLGYYVHD
jgi:hypothetical protein